MDVPSETIATITAALQASLHTPDANEAEGNYVTGWVAVAESVAPDGERWISRIDGTPGGTRLTDWQREGLLFNALHSGGWDDEPQPPNEP